MRIKEEEIERIRIKHYLPDDLPLVQATRKGDQLIIKCPYCEKSHIHGGGEYIGFADGYRTSHCFGGGEYYIYEMVHIDKIKKEIKK